jgi:hypothetical protein
MLTSHLRRRKRAPFAPQRLTVFAGGSNGGTVRAVFAATDVAKHAGSVAANAIGSRNRSFHLHVCLVFCASTVLTVLVLFGGPFLSKLIFWSTRKQRIPNGMRLQIFVAAFCAESGLLVQSREIHFSKPDEVLFAILVPTAPKSRIFNQLKILLVLLNHVLRRKVVNRVAPNPHAV